MFLMLKSHHMGSAVRVNQPIFAGQKSSFFMLESALFQSEINIKHWEFGSPICGFPKIGGTPKWMVYKGKSQSKMDDK